MSSYAGAYGAQAGSDVLRQVLTDKILADKVAEDNRRQAVTEAGDAADRAARADQFRQTQAGAMERFVSDRDSTYQDRLARRQEMDTAASTRVTERASDAALADSRTAAELKARIAERALDTSERATAARASEAFQMRLAGARSTPKETPIHWDKDGNGYRVGADNVAIPIAMPGHKPGEPDKKQVAFKADLDTFSRNVYGHKGLSSAGAGLNLGRSYSAEFGNLKSAADQLESVYMSDPDVMAKIAAQKPATDADVKRALKQAIGIDVEQMDAPTIQREINRLRAKADLPALGGTATGADLGKGF